MKLMKILNFEKDHFSKKKTFSNIEQKAFKYINFRDLSLIILIKINIEKAEN